MNDSDSSKLPRLRDFLKDKRFPHISEIRANNSAPGDFLLLVAAEHVANRVDRKHTSLRQMKRLQAEIKMQLGMNVEWVVADDSRVAALQSALFEALKARFPDKFDALMVTTPQILPTWVWVDSAPGVKNRPSEEALGAVATDLFRAFGLDRPMVAYTDSAELPSNPMILRSLNAIAPATVEGLFQNLHHEGNVIPDVRWLQRKLDNLRRNGLLVRARQGTYALTELGLSLVPHGPSRSSSDVQRALALGRRTW